MIDAKKVDEIRARHEAAKARVRPVGDDLHEAQADRGWLLDAIAKAQKAERAAHPLQVVQVPALAVGVRVRAKHKPEHDRQFNEWGNACRASNDGKTGVIAQKSDSHGECWGVEVEGRIAWYEPDELTPEPVTSRVFEPTAEEVAACAVLAEVAGKTEREAVDELARRLAEMTMKRDETALRVIEVGRERDALKRQRPRVGPWVELTTGTGSEYEARFDASGHEVAAIWNHGNGWQGRVLRPFRERVMVGGVGFGMGQARAAVDAVLREWADLDGQEAADPVPIMSQRRTWTGEQIRAAFCKASGRADLGSDEVVSVTWDALGAALLQGEP